MRELKYYLENGDKITGGPHPAKKVRLDYNHTFPSFHDEVPWRYSFNDRMREDGKGVPRKDFRIMGGDLVIGNKIKGLDQAPQILFKTPRPTPITPYQMVGSTNYEMSLNKFPDGMPKNGGTQLNVQSVPNTILPQGGAPQAGDPRGPQGNVDPSGIGDSDPYLYPVVANGQASRLQRNRFSQYQGRIGRIPTPDGGNLIPPPLQLPGNRGGGGGNGGGMEVGGGGDGGEAGDNRRPIATPSNPEPQGDSFFSRVVSGIQNANQKVIDILTRPEVSVAADEKYGSEEGQEIERLTVLHKAEQAKLKDQIARLENDKTISRKEKQLLAKQLSMKEIENQKLFNQALSDQDKRLKHLMASIEESSNAMAVDDIQVNFSSIPEIEKRIASIGNQVKDIELASEVSTVNDATFIAKQIRDKDLDMQIDAITPNPEIKPELQLLAEAKVDQLLTKQRKDEDNYEKFISYYRQKNMPTSNLVRYAKEIGLPTLSLDNFRALVESNMLPVTQKLINESPERRASLQLFLDQVFIDAFSHGIYDPIEITQYLPRVLEMASVMIISPTTDVEARKRSKQMYSKVVNSDNIRNEDFKRLSKTFFDSILDEFYPLPPSMLGKRYSDIDPNTSDPKRRGLSFENLTPFQRAINSSLSIIPSAPSNLMRRGPLGTTSMVAVQDINVDNEISEGLIEHQQLADLAQHQVSPSVQRVEEVKVDMNMDEIPQARDEVEVVIAEMFPNSEKNDQEQFYTKIDGFLPGVSKVELGYFIKKYVKPDVALAGFKPSMKNFITDNFNWKRLPETMKNYIISEFDRNDQDIPDNLTFAKAIQIYKREHKFTQSQKNMRV